MSKRDDMARRAFQRQRAGQRETKSAEQLVDLSTKVVAGLRGLAGLVDELPNVEDEELEQVIDLIGRLTAAAVFLSRATMAARDGLPPPKPDIIDQSALQALGAMEQRIAAGADPLA